MSQIEMRLVSDEEVAAAIAAAHEAKSEGLFCMLVELAQRRERAMGGQFEVTTLLSADNHLPVVAVKVGSFMGQLTPDEARQQGHIFFHAASVAEVDAFLYGFARNRMGASDEEARAIITLDRTDRTEYFDKANKPT
jgi:hypothetical protein